MSAPPQLDERQRILRYWWMLELFSPQPVPKPTGAAAAASDQRVVAWPGKGRDHRLPWERLRPPEPWNGRPRVWQHTLYLGVYELEGTCETLHRAFHDDRDAYDERPGGVSACAGMLVDQHGRVLPESAVLSSALWAVARIRSLGARHPGWADGFAGAQSEFVATIDASEVERAEAADDGEPPPLDQSTVRALLHMAHEGAGIAGVPGLATQQVVIKSVAIPADRADDAADIDFLNSFYLDDLETVRSRVAEEGPGAALQAYLTGDDSLDVADRVDVIGVPSVVDAGVSLERLPLGRWPADPGHALALSQQFAVNHALNDLAGVRGLMGVNGPPGTGKTTMLRDILAGNVVERARRLAALTHPEDAFTTVRHDWNQGDYRRQVPGLRAELTGFEMVVASANNAAVDNVTVEIPSTAAIKGWPGRADYFADIATEVLRAGDDAAHDGEQLRAWGLVAARLGNKRNRGAFRRAFWFDETDPRTKQRIPGKPPRMDSTLEQWADGTVPCTSWADARAAFSEAEARVGRLTDERREARDRLGRLAELAGRERDLAHLLERLGRDRQQAGRDLDGHRPAERRAHADHEDAVGQYQRHGAIKPGLLETLLTMGRALSAWRAELAPLADALRAAEHHRRDVDVRGRELRDRVGRIDAELARATAELADVRNAHARLGAACDLDRERFGAGYPDLEWVGERRELRAPWLDPELDAARSELFLAALRLHRDFLANTAGRMRGWLRAATEVVGGAAPQGLDPDKRRAAWQLFFLVVPLVSTTFASLGRMFGTIGKESIGWLLIDEAGQASPQYAVGGIWRARRVVAVGDPLQLQPVVTIPRKAERDIAATYGVSSTWIPPAASVQTLADRVARYGTTLPQADADVWVSAPLRVHRRCDEPMFSLCNRIAYRGIMVNGVHRDLDDPQERFDSPSEPLVAASWWAHEPARTPGTHLQGAEIDRLKAALGYLAEHGVPAADVIAISPFRPVANALETLSREYPGLRAGTIHTAQGREAPVVVLVLGGDPAKPGAKAWASETVNLINVAVSRAQRRLYVIGDRAAWSRHRYFDQLSASLRAGAV